MGVDWGRIPTCTPYTFTLHAHTASTQLLHVLPVMWAGQISQAHSTSLENNLFCFGKATQSCSQTSCRVNMFHVGAQTTKAHASWHMCQLCESYKVKCLHTLQPSSSAVQAHLQNSGSCRVFGTFEASPQIFQKAFVFLELTVFDSVLTFNSRT